MIDVSFAMFDQFDESDLAFEAALAQNEISDLYPLPTAKEAERAYAILASMPD